MSRRPVDLLLWTMYRCSDKNRPVAADWQHGSMGNSVIAPPEIRLAIMVIDIVSRWMEHVIAGVLGARTCLDLDLTP